MHAFFLTPKRITTIVICSCMLLFYTQSPTNTGGAPGGYSNAPNESNCTTCHGGTLQTSGTNYSNVKLTNTFSGGGYIPDSTYTLTLDYTHSGKSKFGYQLTCLDGSNKMAGSFSLQPNNIKSSITSSTIGGSSRSYMRQTRDGTSGSGSISWSFRWKAPSTNKDTLTIYAVVNSTNSSSTTSGDIIIAKEFKIPPSNLLPVAKATTNNTTSCQSKSIQLSGSGTNSPTSYSWRMPGGSPSISNQQNPSVVYNYPGKYNAILTVSNAKGKSKPDTVKIQVLPSPGPFITGGNKRLICPTDSIKLKPTLLEPNVIYTWSNGQTQDSIWVSSKGTYYVSAKGPNGCERSSNSVSVDFYESPKTNLSTSTLNQGDSVCAGSIVNLFSDSINFDTFYYFANRQLLQKTTIPKFDTFIDRSTLFGLQVKDNNGCLSDTSTYFVTASKKLTPPSLICTALSPDSLQFSWTNSTIHDGYEISTDSGQNWNYPSAGFFGTSHKVGGLMPEDSVTLWIRGLDNSPCKYSEIGIQTCYSKPCSVPDVTVSADSTLCEGDNWNIEVNGLRDYNYGLTFNSGKTFTDTAFSLTPLVSKNYLLQVVDSSYLNCPAKEIYLPLQINKIPEIELVPSKSSAFCEGESIEFSASDSMEKWTFLLNTIPVQSGNSNTYTNNSMKDGDSLQVIVTKGKCMDTSSIVRVTIEKDIDASFNYSRQQSTYSFVPKISSHQQYTWDFGDGSPVSTQRFPTHNFKTSEGNNVTVNLTVTTINRCVDDSSRQISLPLFSAINPLNNHSITIYPNPVRDHLNVYIDSPKKHLLKILNASGKQILKTTLHQHKNTVLLPPMNKGIYLIEISSKDGICNTRIFKE